MDLSHLLQLVSEIPQNTTLQYVRGTDQCTFVNVDIDGERINSVAPNGEDKSWAPSYLEDLAPKIFENVPFNLSGLLNNKGSYRPVLETIIAHTKEFYTVKKGTATALVWIPSKPKDNLGLEEIDAAEIPAPNPHGENTPEVNEIIFNPIIDQEYSVEELGSLLNELNSTIEDGKKTSMFTLFGLKYGKFIDNATEVLRAAGFKTNTHSNSISTGKQLYEFICNRKLGLAFWNTQMKISQDIGLSENNSSVSIDDAPRQIIWYGAPGTGKSFTVNKETNKANSVRTTFHPDTDYASFVGTYKPTLQPVKPMYHNIQGREEEISYKFVPQVFLKAYVAAWKNYVENPEAPKPYYLVIEEINRGNCAQIFGDLFQLLDREEDGTSTYEIVPDTDIEKFLRDDERGFADVAEIDEFSADIKNGKILKLPSNLFIYATMNTSDQSLFPIDSAFKRRWEWRYTPIAKPVAKNWTISANDKTWSWWKFLERINFEIGKATESEDKKLGYFFARAKKTDPADIDNNNGVIDASTFVSKVLFYLWNDVIKDNDFNGDLLRDRSGKQLDFTRFFKIVDGKTVPDEELVEQFIENVMKVELPDDNSDSDSSKDVESKNTITVNGEAVRYINAVPYTTIKKYIELHPELTADQVNDIWNPFSKYSLRPWLTSTVQQDYAEKLICADGSSLWVNKDGWMHDPSKQRDTLQEFIDAVNASDFGVTIKESKAKE